jgi:hypothetical protein
MMLSSLRQSGDKKFYVSFYIHNDIKFSGFQTYVGRTYKVVVMMYWGMKAQLHAILISVFQLRQAVVSVFWAEGWRGSKM